MDYDFDDFGPTPTPPVNTPPETVPPTPPVTTPPETVPPVPTRFYGWFIIAHPGADLLPNIDNYVDEYIQYLEKNKSQKLHATIKVQALHRGRVARENIRLLRNANLLKRLEGEREHQEAPSLLTPRGPHVTPRGPHASLLTPRGPHVQRTDEDSWIGSMKNMILSGIFNYTIDQLRDTHRLSIILQNHDLEDNLGFNVDSLDDMPLEGSVQGSIYVQWHAREKVGSNDFGETTMDFPYTRSNLLKDDFIRGYTYIAGRNTITSNSSEDIIGVITRARETPQINIIICKSGRKTSEETLKKWSKENIPIQLANIIQNKFRKTISEVMKGTVLRRNSDGIFDYGIMVNTLTNILNDSIGVLQPNAREDPVRLPSNIVMENTSGQTYFYYQPPPQQPPPPINRKALVPTDLKPMEVPPEVGQIQVPHLSQDITVACKENLYYSMFVNYWFNGLTPELNKLSEQVDLRHVTYDILKTLHPKSTYDIELRYIYDGKGHDEAFEKLFHYDFYNRREMFNEFVGMITLPLTESDIDMKFAFKFALFDLDDLVPTMLDETIFGADFVSTMRFHSKPNDDQLKETGITSGKLPASDYKAVMANIYYSLSTDLISSGNIKLMFILLDKIKEMCRVQPLFQPKNVDYYRKVFLTSSAGDRVPIDAHRQYIQAFQQEMGFSNHEQIRHGTLASAFNEYVYNAEINRSRRIWKFVGNPYRAKIGTIEGGMGKRLIRWFPRLGDMVIGRGMMRFPGGMESLVHWDGKGPLPAEDSTPVFEYIDNNDLPKCVDIFLESRPPWMNTIYQKNFYWFLLGVFCSVAAENDDRIPKTETIRIPKTETMMHYLNLNIPNDKRFKNITELKNWMVIGSIGYQLFIMGLSAWGIRNVHVVNEIKESLFRWYSEKKKINNVVNRI